VLFLLGIAPMLWAGWPWPGGGQRTAGHRRPGWLIAAALALTAPLGGHAGGGTDPVYGAMVGWVHYASAAVWMGGLILLLACVLPRSGVKLGDYVPQFSAIATASIIVATISGSMQSWRQLGSFDAIITTTYGWFLLAKLAAFGLLMLVAAGSHYLTKQAATAPEGLPAVLRPRRQGPGAALAIELADPAFDAVVVDEARRAGLLRKFVIAEAIVAVLVILATELMANTVPSYVEVKQEQAVVQETGTPADPGAVQVGGNAGSNGDPTSSLMPTVGGVGGIGQEGDVFSGTGQGAEPGPADGSP
jgi:copper transport protein